MKRKKIQKLMRYWQDRLFLRDWTLNLRINEHNEESAPGLAQALAGRQEADIIIDPTYDGDMDGLVCHEALHIVFDRIDTFSRQWGALLPPECQRAYAAQWEEHVEQMVDQLQRALCVDRGNE